MVFRDIPIYLHILLAITFGHSLPQTQLEQLPLNFITMQINYTDE